MKRISLLLPVALVAVTICTAQQVRDHRRTSQPSNPQPGQTSVYQPGPAGPAVASIVPGKWYHIKKAGTKSYLTIDGHRNLTRSNAVLALEAMQQDNTAQQWRFVTTEVNGSTIYKLENKKYTGVLRAAPRELFLEQPRDIVNQLQKTGILFMMVLNPDKSWYMITRPTGDNRILALSSEIKNARHCMPAESAPLIGGRVLKDYECADDFKRDYVTQPAFTGMSNQKWILEEARGR